MKWIVYCTTCIINNKVYYGVHKTENPDVFDNYIGNGIRINSPSSYMNPTTPFQAAVKKYGTSNFKRTIIKVFDTPKGAYDMEAIIVDKDFIKRKDNYNVHIGGLGGSSCFRKVYQYKLSGEFLREWDAIIDASDFYEISDTAIRNACDMGYSSKGFFWSFDKIENGIDVSNKIINKGTPCYKYDAETLKFVESYESFPAAAKANGVRLMVIERAVAGKYKCGEFFYSRELSDEFVPYTKMSLRGKPLYVYTLDGDFVIELKNSKEICSYFNIKSTSSVTTAMRTGRQYKNYQLSLEKVEKMAPRENKRNISKPIIQYTMDGQFIKQWDSITSAENEYGKGVSKVLKGQQSHCKHFIWKYANKS